ncbi:MAG: 50S ribosomal protein L13 [archaeon]|jgi:large subunit ribosomal protein L13|nr:50S ribosomal protein L13 [archaeon]
MSMQIVIDANGAILGRLSSFAAKEALKGKKVVVVNCNEILLAGNIPNIIEEYHNFRLKGGSSLKGVFFPKNPERIVKRTIRGMLPHLQTRGEEALLRVMCYNRVPKEFENTPKISMVRKVKTRTIKLSTVLERI